MPENSCVSFPLQLPASTKRSQPMIRTADIQIPTSVKISATTTDRTTSGSRHLHMTTAIMAPTRSTKLHNDAMASCSVAATSWAGTYESSPELRNTSIDAQPPRLFDGNLEQDCRRL
ncbi:uncharacterized protein E0L32_002422 [Thyridium curvatum]|uniref:Uncharacterized protein n=1 Tax=Thyridium curvatum TaxID=1093900 RepID=A0A507B617_9PEZI|nr:uncharacterized protein E0L32_002422 [Thyridium curvatum]TPX18565.1 hypothetical protein E0L32_002422 [Thyridium curvatum]